MLNGLLELARGPGGTARPRLEQDLQVGAQLANFGLQIGRGGRGRAEAKEQVRPALLELCKGRRMMGG